MIGDNGISSYDENKASFCCWAPVGWLYCYRWRHHWWKHYYSWGHSVSGCLDIPVVTEPWPGLECHPHRSHSSLKQHEADSTNQAKQLCHRSTDSTRGTTPIHKASSHHIYIYVVLILMSAWHHSHGAICDNVWHYYLVREGIQNLYSTQTRHCPTHSRDTGLTADSNVVSGHVQVKPHGKNMITHFTCKNSSMVSSNTLCLWYALMRSCLQ